MADSEEPTELENALQQVTLDDPAPSTRRLSIPLSSSPSPRTRVVDLPTISDDSDMYSRSTEGHSSGNGLQGGTDSAVAAPWTEPEAGFEAISLDDGQHRGRVSSDMRPNPASTTSFASSSRRSSTTPPPNASTPSTAPTTVAPTSPKANSIANIDAEHASPPREGATGMSKPPDASKVEQPSPAKKAQNLKGPSMMAKVISMTRQRDLPPKSKEEEEKHLRELADMFAASKEAEKRRRSEVESKAAARAAAMASALPTWETSILPNWRAVLHDTSEGRSLRRLWWQGTMPVRFRGRLWSLCIGNGLAVSKTAYMGALARAQNGLEHGRDDIRKVKEDAERDMERVLPTLKLFQKQGGVMHQDLLDLLLAWSVHDQPNPRYPPGLAYPASLLLVNMPPAEAFISLLNLVSKSFLKSFYASDRDELSSYERVFDTLLADFMPKVYSNFSSLVIRPHLYLEPWLTTLFIGFFPIDLATRLFDVWLLEGDSFLFRVALVTLEILEPRLFNPNLAELERVFEGRDQGAVAIVKREKGLLVLEGSNSPTEEKNQDGSTDHTGVEVEEVYTEMGCTEERVFELLQVLDWKEETWERLVERELPEAV
ncbi:TBC domain-containing protein [Sporobolomyces koalae]|uniref:TBC domain-containing protein n=1 Tax=Sporobolomyces koalae TaxID=500713 RepID=UPI0031710033